MANELRGRTIACLAADGVEQSELVEPRRAVERAGATVELVSLTGGEIQGYAHHRKGERFRVDRAVAAADPGRYDGLVIPGGAASTSVMRVDRDAVRFVRAFVEQRKPVGAICHGPTMLAEAGVIGGRTLTSWPAVRGDVEDAGATWVDEAVHVDAGLVTSRRPADLPAFCPRLVEELAHGPRAGQVTTAGRAAPGR